MKSFIRVSLTLATAMIATTLGVAASTDLQRAGAPAQQDPAPIVLIGCVERGIVPGAKPGAPPAYKLIDTQPGPMATPAGQKPRPPIVVEPQYWLQAPATLDLVKFQNQRVEVTGTLRTSETPVPPNAPKDTPRSTLVVTDVRVINTECK